MPVSVSRAVFPLVIIASVLIASVSPSSAQNSSSALPRITRAISENNLVTLRGNVHPLARQKFDRGVAPPDLPMNRMLLVLKRSPEQEIALTKLLDDLQDKASPQYHHWLTPEQFGQQFGPADSDLRTIILWLQSHGLSVTQVSKGRTVIEVSGTAAQVQQALHTEIHKYVVNGEEHWANASDPQIPAALAPAVAGVYTLHNFVKKPQSRVVKSAVRAQVSPGKAGRRPQITFSGPPVMHALAPADVAKIYNLDPSYQPSVTPPFNPRIGIVARSNINVEDVQSFNSYFPLNGLNEPPSPFVILNGPDPGDLGGDEEAEAVLDATWSGALLANNAPSILLVVSATTNTTDGIDLSELYIVDNNFADVMSESFGACEADATSTQAIGAANLAEQAAAEGITFVAAAGDSGAEACDDPGSEPTAQGPLSTVLPAATPYTVAVGGTKLNENGIDSQYWNTSNTQYTGESALSYIPEDVWNDSCTSAQCGASNANIYAGGGGVSSFFAKPSWQSGISGIPADGARDVPDVSLSASSHDAYILCVDGSCTPDAQGYISLAGVGGTSASTAVFAGIMGLVDLTMSSRQGQANYVLYKLAAATSNDLAQCDGSKTSGLPASNCVFNDVTVGNNSVPGETGFGSSAAHYQSGVGYDLATGLGSVNIMNLLSRWSSATFSATSTVISSTSPISISHGQPVTVDVQVTSNNGTPTGVVTLLANTGNYETEVGTFPLASGSCSCSSTSLPGGTYTLTARYSGDGTFAPSTSQPSQSITVNPEPSTTTFQVLGYPNLNFVFPLFTNGSYGTFVYLLADVAGQSQNGVPTGSVLFYDATYAVPGNPYILNSQGNTAAPNGIFAFPVGTHTITANYSGDGSFLPSGSGQQSFTITPASTTVTVSAIPSSTVENFTATVSTNSGGNPPSGSVTFVVNGVSTTESVIGVAANIDPQTDAIVAGAQATAMLGDSSLTGGATYNVTASYSGDSNYTASSGSASGTVQQDFSIAPSPATLNVAAGQSASTTIVITALGGFNGTINFTPASCAGLPVGAACTFSPASVTGSTNATLTISTTGSAVVAGLRHRSSVRGWSLLGFSLVGAVVVGIPSKRRWKGLLALVAVAILATSCGGGGGSSSGQHAATPTGTYTITVTATSGSLSHATTVTLSVS